MLHGSEKTTSKMAPKKAPGVARRLQLCALQVWSAAGLSVNCHFSARDRMRKNGNLCAPECAFIVEWSEHGELFLFPCVLSVA